MKRRDFLTGSALAGTSLLMGGSVAGGAMLTGCSDGGKSGGVNDFVLKSREELGLPLSLRKAVDGKPLRAGLIGCGGRATGAGTQFIQAGDGLSVVALAEALQERLDGGLKYFNEKMKQNISKDHAFLGFDAYKKVIALPEVDVIIAAVPPRFHPEIFKAAVDAGKPVFIEKPFAVDAAGVRTVLVAAKQADQKGLSVCCGTYRRHMNNYIETYRRVASGMIGEIVSGACYWNTARTWYRDRRPEWSDTEHVLYNWLNYPFMGGDCINDHQIHNIDVVRWFMGDKTPMRAIGQGAKIRPSLGNKYDFFMVDYEFENNIHIISSTRHIDQCSDLIGEVVRGTKGSSNCSDTIWDEKGNVIYKYEPEKDENGKPIDDYSGFQQEHIDWVTSIRENKPFNDANNMANSTLACIMGRESAYTGKTYTWDQILVDQNLLGPDITQPGFKIPEEHPLPGKATEPHKDTKISVY